MTAATVSQAVATRETGIVSVMWQRKTHFAAILPDHIEVKGFLGTAAAALYGNADLMRAAETSPDTLITALMRCAALGHQPGTDEFYLTPRKKKGVPQVLGIEGYRGIVERMYRSGAVASVVVREVCAKDKFRYVEGLDDKPVHGIGGTNHTGADATGADFFGASGTRDRGEMVGVYAYAQLTTGAVSRVVILNRDDVLAARDAGGYRADDSYSPWNRLDAGKDHPEFTGRSMWWKTAARRLEPWVPTSAEYRREQLRAAVQAAGPAAAPPASAPDTEIHDAIIVDDTPDTPARAAHTPPGRAGGGPAKATSGQVRWIQDKWKKLGYDPRDADAEAERLAFTARAAGLEELAATGDLTQDQGVRVRGLLEPCTDRAQVIERLYAGDGESGESGESGE